MQICKKWISHSLQSFPQFCVLRGFVSFYKFKGIIYFYRPFTPKNLKNCQDHHVLQSTWFLHSSVKHCQDHHVRKRFFSCSLIRSSLTKNAILLKLMTRVNLNHNQDLTPIYLLFQKLHKWKCFAFSLKSIFNANKNASHFYF